NLGPDANQFRWLVPDRPFQSLAAQTFMRDYFQPGLIERISNCSLANDCTTSLKPLPAIADLNRTLPVVTITGVEQGATPDEALVSIEVREGVDADAPNGKTKSGVFNPRVFRDFRFAAHTPDSDFELDQSRTRWREVNRMTDDDDKPGDGVHHFEAKLFLPTAAGTEEQFISAYAFNEDRIKSDTAHYAYTRPTMTPRKPRAFVISIGVDDYVQNRLDLNYAAADAKLMKQRLAGIPGFETRTVIATSEAGRGVVTADSIRMLLAILSGEYEKKDLLPRLKAEGIDASALDMVGPDDVVIITFSGHGWTQKDDDFYLLASDAKWPDRDPLPDIASLISSSELTMWLRMINAADIALVIDACHSGASVDSGSFKPGPLGDAGLGQLAYDKGIRILAATQADDVAMENANLRHGLLTFALAGDGEGLTRTDGLVDLDFDGKVSLSEWLAYPTWRLLDFNEDERLSEGSKNADESVAFAFPNRTVKKEKKVQTPSLFDFTVSSKVTLKELAK
ncbi:MAG TPA: caspase family protein, partial [Sphingorhabdus sp.]|nr:caspase family protein [Sphingorhabdus sp.]